MLDELLGLSKDEWLSARVVVKKDISNAVVVESENRKRDVRWRNKAKAL